MAIIRGRNLEGEHIARKNRVISSIQVAQQNADQVFRERQSSQAASRKSTAIQAGGQVAAASLRAGVKTTNTQRLLSEFESSVAQRKAAFQRQVDQAQGQSKAAFGASNIQSIGAQQEALREGAIQGNLQASQINTQREQLLGQARNAITDALATGIGAASSLRASSVQGELFKRQISTETGIAPRFKTIYTGLDQRASRRS